ncbi:unnamed protein product [Brassicogethes aeneus]|uniref:Transcriptional adapter 3 n=1 Tax=Brassicogethes aeneus TaxID=1431903 RepID=A0A9P0FLK4_BRAAE|nr:unnamed protein product [Brassicogethes aeneus]
MNGKRSYLVPKSTSSKYNGKLKDILSSTRHKSEGKYIEHENNLANIPIIKQTENARLLTKYTAVLARSAEDGVNMDDLDQLQHDLEKLLSTSVSRSRFLTSEIESIDKVEENRDKKEKNYDKTPLKRKRPDDKPKYKDFKNGARVIKKQYGLPVNNLLGDAHLQNEVPKVALPKNDNSDKFWASIEPYCANVSKEDVTFIESLLEEFSKEIDIKIPEMGDHYAHEWSEELLSDEQGLGRSPKSKSGQNSDIKKNGLSALVETITSQHTQKLLAALKEEKPLSQFPNMEKLKADLSLKSNGPRVGVCMDSKLEQTILNLEEVPKNTENDEILAEIRKCQQELKTINEYNLEELKKLKTVVENDLQKQQVKEELEKIDNQVLDLYNKVLIAKKQAQQAEGDEYDKNLFMQQLANDFEAQADDILKQQNMLHTWAYPESNAETPNNDQYFVDVNV